MTEVEAGTKPHLGLHVGRSEVAARVISALKDMVSNGRHLFDRWVSQQESTFAVLI